MARNNPYHMAAGLYDWLLLLPGISLIRRQEAEIVGNLIASQAQQCETALEIGPGTGFYTTMLAGLMRQVTAVEDSRGMAEILSRKLAKRSVGNVTVLTEDFRKLDLEGGFDLVVAIGVLDYVPDVEPFVAKMRAAARKAVIFTIPQCGLLGSCFAAGSKLRRISVYRHQEATVSEWAGGWRCAITEVGLKTPLTRGLTLVAALERG